MLSDRLAIPLNPQSRRQHWRRALKLIGGVALVATLGYLADRAIHLRASPQRWPTNANLEFRLIKTPQTVRFANTYLTGTQGLLGTPWDMAQLLDWSKRELVIYTDNQAVVGMVIDGDLPPDVWTSLSNWGWAPIALGQRTLLLPAGSNEPGQFERHINPWFKLPGFNGTFTIKDTSNQAYGVPFRLSSRGQLDVALNMSRFIPSTRLVLGSDVQLTGSFFLPPHLSTVFLPNVSSANFPGLQQLSHQAQTSGLTVLIGHDAIGTAMVLSMPSPDWSLETLGAIATEGASLQSLSTTVLTNDRLITGTEIRSATTAQVHVTNNEGLLTATANTSDKQLFRLTQSSAQLIVSNREAIIGLTPAINVDICLRNPNGFLHPQQLMLNLPDLQTGLGGDLFHFLYQADTLAFRKHRLRICWG